MDKKHLRKIKKSPRKNILAISIFIGSILLSGCNNFIKPDSKSIKSSSKNNEIGFIPASREEMNFYRQVGITYFCLARQDEIEFPKSISIASKNFALIVSKKHGGFIEEVGEEKLTSDQIYQGAYLQLVEGAIQLCPNQVPEDDKKTFLEAVEQLNQNN